jgi:hypothetical protein
MIKSQSFGWPSERERERQGASKREKEILKHRDTGIKHTKRYK